MNKQVTIEDLKKEWIKSGAYVHQSFKAWYNDRAERIASSWFVKYAVK